MRLRGEVYSENKRGPRTDPWGTPVSTGEAGVVAGGDRNRLSA